jgi:16S rRNA pseudouridine516 synthase
MHHFSPSSLRLDRLLAKASGLSRSDAQRAIRRGEVQVDGVPLTDPAAHVASNARIELAGAALAATGPRYFMLHKPAGYVCAATDREHRTVLDLLDVPNKAGLHIAGRLDLDATGLVLITDDGDWSHRVTAPRRGIPKTYRVTLAAPLSADAVAALRIGVTLRGEPRPCAPAGLETLGETVVRLTITEGKYHQVKRMFAAVGNHVVQLHRESIGAVRLDPGLAAGGVRVLTADEVGYFGAAADRDVASEPGMPG